MDFQVKIELQKDLTLIEVRESELRYDVRSPKARTQLFMLKKHFYVCFNCCYVRPWLQRHCI